MSNKQENLHKEIELIQGVISRMANNSFLVKGWTMTLMSALIAFGKDLILEPVGGYYLIMMLSILFPFWWLDSFYLRQERIFRKIYERAIDDPEATQRVRYDMNPRELSRTVPKVHNIMATDSVRWFYFPFILLIAAGAVLKFMRIW